MQIDAAMLLLICNMDYFATMCVNELRNVLAPYHMSMGCQLSVTHQLLHLAQWFKTLSNIDGVS